MSEKERVMNILAFLAILFGESDLWQSEIMQLTPEYLIEKFNRYILTDRDASSWGMNPSLKKGTFDRYLKKHFEGIEE